MLSKFQRVYRFGYGTEIKQGRLCYKIAQSFKYRLPIPKSDVISQRSFSIIKSTRVVEPRGKNYGHIKYWRTSGIDPNQNFFTPRTRLLKFLEAYIKKAEGPILLRSPYASGKTSLLTEARSYFKNDYTVISVSMLCSSTCKNDTFSSWLASHAVIEEDYSAQITTFWDLLRPGVFSKPVLILFDEIQALYNADYATSFWETLKYISENPSKWNVQEIVAAGVYGTIASTSIEFTRSFGTELLYFDVSEVETLIKDFNMHNGENLSISTSIAEPLWSATGGHPGFVINCLKTIEGDYSKQFKFELSDWYKWKLNRFTDALFQSRLAQHLFSLPELYPEWKKVVTQLLQSSDGIQETSLVANPMIKAGIIAQIGPNSRKFTFANPAIRLLLLNKTLDPLICAPKQDYKWFNSLLDIITVCIPLLNHKSIVNCLSTTLYGSIESLKEFVWQDHFFASLQWLLPPKFRIDSEYPVSHSNLKTGSVNFRVAGPSFSGSIEWLVTEYEWTPETVKQYIFEHYYRFVKDPTGKYLHKYENISTESFLVINVSHKPSNIDIPGKLPGTYAELTVDDLMKNVELHIDGFKIPIEMGKPFIYNFKSKDKVKPKIIIPEEIQNRYTKYMKCVLDGKATGIIQVTNESTLYEARLLIMDELNDIPTTFKFTKYGIPFTSKQERNYKCVDVGEILELSVK